MPTEKKLTGYPSIDKPWLKYYTEEQINLPLPKNTAYQYMRECNRNNLNAYALEYLGKKITYRELFRNIDLVANCLLSMGVKKGDVITSCLANMPESAYLIYAANKLGVIIDLIDPFTVNETMAAYCNNTNSKIVFTLDIAYKNVEKLPENTSIEKIVLVSPAQSIKLLKTLMKAKSPEIRQAYKNAISWDAFIKNNKSDSDEFAVNYQQDLPFAILHTGGTTGIPKGALLSVDNVNSLASQFMNSPLEMNQKETALNLMPPFAAYGLCNGLHLHLCCGMKVIMIPTYEPSKIVDQILKHKPNRIACAPAHYVHIAESAKMRSADLSFLIRPIVGGDTLNTKLEEELNELFANAGCKDKITKGYGLTETASGVCVCVNKAVNKIGSVGIPMAKNVIAAFDLSGEEIECAYNEEGEICICSPNNMLGYYNKPEETAKVLKTHKDGKVWLHTGDLGYVDEDGNIFIKGRLKRMIIQYSGLKANPFEAEREILKNANVNSVVVVGVKDPNHPQGQLPVAFVKLEEGISVNEQDLTAELHKSCEDNITYYSVPVDYIVIDMFPRTPIGKIDFKELTNIYERDYKGRVMLKQKELKF